MRWWFISDDDVRIIKDGLDAPTHGVNDFNCPDHNDYCVGCEGDEKREKARYALDVGLHKTDLVPDDFIGG